MQIGMIGLGKMGANMARRLMADGHECVGYDVSPENVKNLSQYGADTAASLSELIQKLTGPRVIWCMVPAGEITENLIAELSELVDENDIIIDGGNSLYKDDVRRAGLLAEKNIRYVDVGTSGGVWGVERGYCLMIGGDKATVDYLNPVFQTLAPGKGEIEATPGRENMQSTAEDGYLHCGPAGSGHFVKMIHNGIEYGMMMAYAEGFDILRNANSKELPEELQFDLDLKDIAEVWRRGSVVGSWLLDLTAISLAEDPELEGYSGHVADSGEGRWTVQAAIDEAVPANVLTAALFARFRSRQGNTFAEKMLSAMRKQFGGHVEKK